LGICRRGSTGFGNGCGYTSIYMAVVSLVINSW